MKHLLLCLFFFTAFGATLSAQTLAMPDSAMVVKNKVKTVRIYSLPNDGKRYLEKFMTYDKSGRVIREQETEYSYYYEYTYDSKGRRTLSTQRTAKGEFIQKFSETYNEKDGTRTVALCTSGDSVTPRYVYVYNAKGWKIRDEQYNPKGIAFLNVYEYDTAGNQIASYDSVANIRTATYRKNGTIQWQRTYSPKNALLHQYRYKYNAYGFVSDFYDSTGSIPVVHYALVYNTHPFPDSVQRNGVTLKTPEFQQFQLDYPSLFPAHYQDGSDDYALPVPDLVNEHHFTYDKKGNIVRDDLVQKQGSYSQTFVFVYEYEFY